jgi:hypothetical protein
MVKVWADSAYDLRHLRRSLPSLLASNLPEDCRVVLIDDRSPHPRVAGLLAGLAARHPQVEVWTNPQRLGPNKGQEVNFPKVVERFPGAEFFVLSDDDLVYHPGWLQRLIQIYREAKAEGLLGICSALNVPQRPHFEARRLPTCEVLLKERQAALNWLLPRAVYEKVGPFRDRGVAFDHDYQDRTKQHNIPVICLRPSWVQNVGYRGAYQYGTYYTAHDYVGRLGVGLRLSYAWWHVWGRAYWRGYHLWGAVQRRRDRLLRWLGLRAPA